MTLTFEPELIPLKFDADGNARASGTRVTLDTIVAAFDEGSCPEEIVLEFPTLPLADVYFILGYYLRHRAEVDAHLEEQLQEAEAFQRKMEVLSPPDELWERLLARRAAGAP
ncbi:MAG: DUF433 domain-containing protein [Dehalococcoidia bacterium]